MPKLSNHQHALIFGREFAKDKFESMMDIDNHGDNFSWQKFPEIFESLCKSRLAMSFSKPPNNLTELQNIASKSYIHHGQMFKDEYIKANHLPIRKKFKNT